MKRIVRRDPIVILVGGVVVVCAALGVFERLELTADQVAQLEAGIIMVVSAVAMWVERIRARKTDDRFTPPPSEVDTERGTDGG